MFANIEPSATPDLSMFMNVAKKIATEFYIFVKL